MSTSVRVGIAVVEYRGRYLVGLRGPGLLAGNAEFPGGKCHDQESPAKAACRECLEESGLEVVAVDLLMHRQFNYPHGLVDLEFWLCRPSPRAVCADEHRGFRWIEPSALAALNFPEANKPLIDVLSQQES